MRRGGKTIAVDDSGAGPWNKDWQDRRLGNPMYQALPFEAVGVYHHIRSIAAAHGRDGAVRLAGRHDEPATLKQVAELVAMKMGGGLAAGRRARAILKAIVQARLLVVDRQQVLYVANAAEEWRAGRAWSDDPDAVRQREYRERKRQEGETRSAEVPPSPPMAETDATDRNRTECAATGAGAVVTSGVTSLPISESIPIPIRGDENISNRLGISTQPAARGQPNRPRSGEGGTSADFYAQDPVALWCRLCSEPGNPITERTARKYLGLWGVDAFFGVCAEFREDLERDRAAGKIVDAGRVGSSKIVDFENRRRRAKGLPPLHGGPVSRREPPGFHVGDSGPADRAEVRNLVQAWASGVPASGEVGK